MKLSNLKIITYPHETLLRQALPIERFDGQLEDLAEEMVQVMKFSNGVGLAANQVGVLQRIFVMQCDNTKPPYVFINPEILDTESEEEKNTEGCLSFPGMHVEIKRKKKIDVVWQNTKGESQKETFSGLEAICVQHEIDHLDGIVFTDRLGPVKKQMALQKYKKLKPC